MCWASRFAGNKRWRMCNWLVICLNNVLHCSTRLSDVDTLTVRQASSIIIRNISKDSLKHTALDVFNGFRLFFGKAGMPGWASVFQNQSEYSLIARVSGHYAVQGHSRSHTNRKPVCDFLLILTYTLSCTVRDYWSNLRFRQGIPQFNTHVRGEPLNSGPRNLASINQKHCSIMRCKKCFDILNRLGVNNECDGQTDKRIDGQTDGRTWLR